MKRGWCAGREERVKKSKIQLLVENCKWNLYRMYSTDIQIEMAMTEMSARRSREKKKEEKNREVKTGFCWTIDFDVCYIVSW